MGLVLVAGVDIVPASYSSYPSANPIQLGLEMIISLPMLAPNLLATICQRGDTEV